MHDSDFLSPAVRSLRADLALALRAAAHHGLAEGVCNHFSLELPDASGRFLLNPRGLMWREVHADDIVMVDANGQKLAGRHPVEPSAMFIHAGIHKVCQKACVLHTHMPYATALTLTTAGALDTTTHMLRVEVSRARSPRWQRWFGVRGRASAPPLAATLESLLR